MLRVAHQLGGAIGISCAIAAKVWSCRMFAGSSCRWAVQSNSCRYTIGMVVLDVCRVARQLGGVMWDMRDYIGHNHFDCFWLRKYGGKLWNSRHVAKRCGNTKF